MKMELIAQTINIIIGLIVILTFGISLIQLARAQAIEYQRNKIIKIRNREIEAEKNRPVTMERMTGQIKAINEKYATRISLLEQERRDILDKIPFLKS